MHRNGPREHLRRGTEGARSGAGGRDGGARGARTAVVASSTRKEKVPAKHGGKGGRHFLFSQAIIIRTVSSVQFPGTLSLGGKQT